MSSNNRDGRDFNKSKILYRCAVCGVFHTEPLILDGKTAYCSMKCFDEYKEVSHALADMSLDQLMDNLESLTKEGDL